MTPLKQQKEMSSYQQNTEIAGDYCRPLAKRENREDSETSRAFSDFHSFIQKDQIY